MAAVRFFCLNVLEKDWVQKFTPRVKEPKTLPNHLSPGEVAAIFSSCISIRELSILMLLYSTGLRVSELASIKIEDLKKNIPIIEVIGKGNKKRIVPFCDSLRATLSQYWLHNRKPARTGFLFTSKVNPLEPIKTVEIYQIFKRALKNSGINKKCSPHSLRHSFATRMLELGVSLREIQLMLGHSQLQTTEIYTHIRAAQLAGMKNPLDTIVKSIKLIA
jgi:site-specific recombinase XerD